MSYIDHIGLIFLLALNCISSCHPRQRSVVKYSHPISFWRAFTNYIHLHQNDFTAYYENNFVILVHGSDAIRCRLLWVFTVQTLPPHPTQPVKTRLLIIQTDISGLHGISFSFTYSWKRCIFWGRLEPQDWVKSGWISYVYRNMITSTLYRLNE